jgi:hypothetical protein
MRASIISRPDLVATEEATESILIPASCKTPPRRAISLTRCWAIFAR